MRRLAWFVLLVYVTDTVQPQCLLEDDNFAICNAQGYKTVPTRFKPTITVLRLPNNHISVLPREVLSLYLEVAELNLTNNRLISYQSVEAIYILKKLQILDLSKNSFQIMDFFIFSKNSLLKELVIDDNSNMYINETAVNLRNLTKLSLKNNSISKFPLEALKGFSSLTSLDLRDNHITVLTEEILKILPKLIDLYMKGNPIAKLDYRVLQISDFRNKNKLIKIVITKKYDTDISNPIIFNPLKEIVERQNNPIKDFWYKFIWCILAAFAVLGLLLTVHNCVI